MGIEGRPLDLDVGVVTAEAPLTNLPAGEVCLAPIEESANGIVVFDIAFWDGRWVEDLEVEFTGGVARGVRAARGLDLFNDTIAGASGAGNVIGELGIGLNHEVTAPCGKHAPRREDPRHHPHRRRRQRHAGRRQRLQPALGPARDEPTVTVDGRTLLAGGELVV